jgi:hypothetical protein
MMKAKMAAGGGVMKKPVKKFGGGMLSLAKKAVSKMRPQTAPPDNAQASTARGNPGARAVEALQQAMARQKANPRNRKGFAGMLGRVAQMGPQTTEGAPPAKKGISGMLQRAARAAAQAGRTPVAMKKGGAVKAKMMAGGGAMKSKMATSGGKKK